MTELETHCHKLLETMKEDRLKMPPWKFRCPGIGDRWKILDQIEKCLGNKSVYDGL